ncbi:MAG: HD domain-containing protein, partial [Nitrospinota bacterium]|nr:HD domain-containing protein [Nitrospinota bacterium]
ELTDEVVELLYKSAPLHDIGKVGVPDAILLKPGKLTAEEFEIMKKHAALGADAIIRAEEKLDAGEVSFLRYARQIAYGHHEKWDGSGYPEGLKGEQIPLAARLMAIADVYDALISKRVYKEAFSHDKAREIIVEGRGGHFDPELVDAFLAIEHKFVDIARRYADGDQG